MEKSEREKIRRLNCKAEFIYRNQEDLSYPISPPIHTPRAPYPWESEANLPRITKDFFRCKGNPLNPPLIDPTDPTKTLTDCEGCRRHGLPIIRGKETVYPILIDLLNYIQKKTGKRVIITSGHRCPIHNTYADPSKDNRLSKHQIGAEVDFYVQSMEERPQEIAGLLMQYFKETPLYQNNPESQEFKRLEQTPLSPYTNKEISIKVFQKTEGRNADNHHPHPYLSIQVRYDREAKERVIYDWAKANQGYPRT